MSGMVDIKLLENALIRTEFNLFWHESLPSGRDREKEGERKRERKLHLLVCEFHLSQSNLNDFIATGPKNLNSVLRYNTNTNSLDEVEYTIARRRFGPQTQWRPLHRTLTNGLWLDDMICLWLCPLWFNYWFSFTLAHSRISHEYSSLFIVVINLIFMFSLWCIDCLGSLYTNRNFIYFCIKSSIGTQGEVG